MTTMDRNSDLVGTSMPFPIVRVADGHVRVEGEIDAATAPHLTAALRGLERGDAPVLVIDLGEVTLFTAAGVTALVDWCTTIDRPARIHASLPVYRVLEICGLAGRPSSAWPVDVRLADHRPPPS